MHPRLKQIKKIYIYTTYRYTIAIVSPLHTTYPHHRGGGRTYLSARLLNFVITYYILFPLPHNIPPPQGGRENLSFGTLTIFCHRLLHLVPPSTQHTPTTGGEGGTMTIGGGRRRDGLSGTMRQMSGLRTSKSTTTTATTTALVWYVWYVWYGRVWYGTVRSAMYVCMYVNLFVYLCAKKCMYVSMYLKNYVCTYVCMYVRMSGCMYVRMDGRGYVSMYGSIFINVCHCMYVYKNIRM